jgi:hypothetical protein
MSYNIINSNNVRGFFTTPQVNSSSSPSDGNSSGESSDESMKQDQEQRYSSSTGSCKAGAADNALYSQYMSQFEIYSRAMVAATSAAFQQQQQQQQNTSATRTPRQNDMPRPHASYAPPVSFSAVEDGCSDGSGYQIQQKQSNGLLAAGGLFARSESSPSRNISFQKRILNSFQNQQQLLQLNSDEFSPHRLSNSSEDDLGHSSLVARQQSVGSEDSSSSVKRFSGKRNKKKNSCAFTFVLLINRAMLCIYFIIFDLLF